MRESGCLAVCITVGPMQAFESFRVSAIDFWQNSGPNGLHEHRHYGSCYEVLLEWNTENEHQNSLVRKTSQSHVH